MSSVTAYHDIRTTAARAQQIWLILIGSAKDKKVMDYGMLAEKMGIGKRSARFMGQFLAPIYYYCKTHSLPFLTALVVGKHSRIPGRGLRLKNVAKSQKRVFSFDWYSICPPTRKQLDEFR